MSVIAPTNTAPDLDSYRQQLELVSFAERIHIDVADGKFTELVTVNYGELHWPQGKQIDLHLMVDEPRQQLELLIAKQPNLVIIHAEAAGAAEALSFLGDYQQAAGLALLPQTTVEAVAVKLASVEHCLIFGGSLGQMGGRADLEQLKKIKEIRAINPDIEIGWDGGANTDNAAELAAAGVDVINVGSAIHSANNPQDAYAKLSSIVEEG